MLMRVALTLAPATILRPRIRNLIADNLTRFSQGETLLNVLDKPEGY